MFLSIESSLAFSKTAQFWIKNRTIYFFHYHKISNSLQCTDFKTIYFWLFKCR